MVAARSAKIEAIRDYYRDYLETVEDQYDKYDVSGLNPPRQPLYSMERQKELVRGIVLEAVTDHEYTNDIVTLSKDRLIPIFIYGRQKMGMPDHPRISSNDAILLHSKAYTAMNKLQMYTDETPLQRIPYLSTLPEGNGGRVEGEIYMVPLDTVLSLDYIHQNGKQCKRIMSAFFVPGQSHAEVAWMYMWNQQFIKGMLLKNTILPLSMYTKKTPVSKDTQTRYFTFTKRNIIEEYKDAKKFGGTTRRDV